MFVPFKDVAVVAQLYGVSAGLALVLIPILNGARYVEIRCRYEDKSHPGQLCALLDWATKATNDERKGRTIGMSTAEQDLDNILHSGKGV